MHLAADILDKQAVDRNGRRIGRIDGIVFEWDGQHAPQLIHVECGARTQLRRIGTRPGVFVLRWLRRVVGRLPRTYRMHWDGIRVTDKHVALDTTVGETPGAAVERWLRQHVIDRIPGG